MSEDLTAQPGPSGSGRTKQQIKLLRLSPQLVASAAAIAAPSVALLVAGCSSQLFNRDSDALDKFSHAYSDFLDDADTAEGLWEYVGPETDPFGFWMTLKAALATDSNSYDAGRLAEASAAIALYEKWMPKVLEGEADEVEKLDKAVQLLFETANAIHNPNYRGDAVRIAKYARAAQGAFASGNDLKDRQFRLTRRLLDDVVSTGGNLAVAFATRPLGTELNEIKTNKPKLESAEAEATTSMRNLKDTFSALKGKTNLKAYPSRDESPEKTLGKGER